MIDIHTHILHSVDDGSANLEMTLELLEEAKKAGFTKIILSSHYMEGYFTADLNTRKDIFAQMEAKKTVDTELYLGNEIFLTESLLNLIREQKAITLNNSRYLLFELPFTTEPVYLMEMVYRMQSSGYTPILAHPERYPYLYKNPEVYEELVDKGVLLQTNFGSYGGQYGRRSKLVAEKLLKSNLVHFIATDVHRPDSVYPEIPNLIEDLKKLVGEEKVYQLTTENPEKVLNNQEIEIEDFDPIKYSFFEKRRIYKD